MRLERTTYNHLVIIPHPPSQYKSTIPPALDELILQCLQMECEDRPQTAREVANRLRKIAADL
jgi:hypothetical protein